ncbi:hypothetical protein SASPL_100908 [Salvia splendens]|uniref:WRKY domain-containing protein n=2 Tax=Salvia splendens TaxID=180675 RepID=A0A8X8YT13_SALSN|nr:hypothetical protein SASPL_100908 [Salvia splendens]
MMRNNIEMKGLHQIVGLGENMAKNPLKDLLIQGGTTGAAKKQVERCKTDASMLIITYTSTHNHPDPAPFSLPTTPNQDSETNPDEIEVPPPNSGDDPLNSTSGHAVGGGGEPFEEILQAPGVRYGDDHGCYVLKSEENDFYDELEELPTSSSFTAFMKSGFYEGRIAV